MIILPQLHFEKGETMGIHGKRKPQPPLGGEQIIFRQMKKIGFPGEETREEGRGQGVSSEQARVRRMLCLEHRRVGRGGVGGCRRRQGWVGAPRQGQSC